LARTALESASAFDPGAWKTTTATAVLLLSNARSPKSPELISIRATDDQTATVTTEDGRQFATEDGGRRWTRVPNP